MQEATAQCDRVLFSFTARAIHRPLSYLHGSNTDAALSLALSPIQYEVFFGSLGSLNLTLELRQHVNAPLSVSVLQ